MDTAPLPPGTLFPKDREVRSLDGTPIRSTSRGRGLRPARPSGFRTIRLRREDVRLDRYVEDLEEASHSLPIEEPDALEALVLGWLAERFPPRSGRGPAAQSGATG